jgi:hypothetical protein
VSGFVEISPGASIGHPTVATVKDIVARAMSLACERNGAT